MTVYKIHTIFFALSESKLYVYEGDSVDVNCEDRELNEVDTTAQTISYLTVWHFKSADRPNKTLVAKQTSGSKVNISEPYERRGIQLRVKDGRLTIPKLELSDNGAYICTGKYRVKKKTSIIVNGKRWNDLVVNLIA